MGVISWIRRPVSAAWWQSPPGAFTTWLSKPMGPFSVGDAERLPCFSVADFVDLPSLASKLKQPGRAVDAWLAERLSATTKATLGEYQGQGSDPAPLQQALLPDLNRFLFWGYAGGGSIYEGQRFSGIALRSETRTLLSQSPEVGVDLARLNRLLLEDAYPLELWSFSTPALSNAVQIAAGRCFSAALRRDGTVVAWGSNQSGESKPPSELQNVVGIAVGASFGLALKGDGRPFILGQSVSRKAVLGEQVMLQTSLSGTTPLACAWLKDGRPLSDGSGITGVRESTLNIAQVSYADEGVYTLTVSNGLGSATSGPITLSVIQVLGWGDDAFGQVDAPRGTRDVVALASGDSHTLALHTDGSISAWGEGDDGQTDSPHETAVAIATGGFHNLALRPDGTVMAWGRNRSGQCEVPVDLANVVAIAAGRAHSLALRADGTVVGWGRTVIPPGLRNVRAIAAGAYHSLALREDGEVVVWGQNRHGECFAPPGLTNVVSIAAGGYHYLALRDDGTVVAWGLNSSGQCNVPANLNNAVAIAAGTHHSAALKSDGSVVTWGLNQSGQCNPPAVAPRIRTVAAGGVYSLAVAAEGRPEFLRPVLVESVQGGAIRLTGFALGEAPFGFQWYWNDQALVDGADINGAQAATVVMRSTAALPGLYSLRVTNALGEAVTAPVTLSGALGPGVRLLAHTRELLRGSRVRLAADVEGAEPIALQWLLNGVPLTDEGGLSGTAASVLQIEAIEPRHAGIYQLSAMNAYGTAVSAGVDVSVCNVRAWGDKRRGQSLLPYLLRGVKQISALADHALALRWDGTIEAWGDNSHGQCDVPLAFSNVIQVAAGGTHSIALSGDGVVTAWGADRPRSFAAGKCDEHQRNRGGELAGLLRASKGRLPTVVAYRFHPDEHWRTGYLRVRTDHRWRHSLFHCPAGAHAKHSSRCRCIPRYCPWSFVPPCRDVRWRS